MNASYVSQKYSQEAVGWSLTNVLAVAVGTVCFIGYSTFLWKRRRLYRFASLLPGPVALPFVGCAWYFAGNVYETFTNIMMMFNTYGGIFKVWFGPRLFVAVSDPKYMEIILLNCLQKEKLYGMVKMYAGEGLFSAPYHKWKMNRKIIAPTFSQKILDTFVEIFSDQGDILVKQMQKFEGRGEFDVFHTINNCTLDIICETAMGVKVNAQIRDSGYTKWSERILEIVFLRIFVLWYHNDRLFFSTPLGKETREIIDKMQEFTGKVVKEKKAEHELKWKEQSEFVEYNSGDDKKKVFLDYLLDLTQSEDAKFSEEQFRNEVDTFIVAGSDTTATTICFTLTTLGLHQHLQDQVYNEIMEILGEDRKIDPNDLPKLKFLERFIKETMRLFPIAGIIVRAIEKDVDVGDYIIPGGTSAVLGILKVHTNETYWPDPYKFDPDRFLPEEVAKRPQCSYMPFSYGPRNCIGMKYAMMAMKSVIVSILRKYRLYTNYKDVQDINLQQSLTLKPKDGFKVFIRNR